MRTFKISVLFVVLIILCGLATADIVPNPGTLRVKPVFDKADLVCGCFTKSLEVLKTELLGTGPKGVIRRRIRATVGIHDLYKSNGQGNGPIFVEFVEILPDRSGVASPSSQPALWQGETALLFLTQSQPDAYTFADPFLGATSFHFFPRVHGESGLGKLQHALADMLDGADRDDRIRALQLLHGFDSFNPETLSAIDPLCRSEDPEIVIPALGVLLKTKTPESVERLNRYLKNYKSDVQPLALISVGSELSQIDNIKSLGAIEELSNSTFVAVRYGAMDAMRRIKSPRSVPTLVAKLDDPDSAVQYVALITLAEIIGKYDGDFAPSMYLFDKRPQYYIGLWKQWWADEGSKLYQPSSAPK